MTRRITWPVGGNVGAAVSDVDDLVPLPVNGGPVLATDPRVPTILANVPTSAMTLLTDAIGRSASLTTTVNTLLSELRAAGIISP